MSNETTEEVVKPDYQALLTENYAIDTDKLNIILKERFAKRDGKGKFAQIIEGEYSWKPIGYFRDMAQVAKHLVKYELLKDDDNRISEIRHYADVIESLKESIESTLVEKITIIQD